MDKNSFTTLKDFIKRIIVSNEFMSIISIFVVIQLMLSPFSMDKMNLIDSSINSNYFYPFGILFSANVYNESGFFYILCLALFLIPVFFIINFGIFAYKKIYKKTFKNCETIFYILLFISVTVYLSAFIVGMVVYANTNRWFYSLSFFSYFAFFNAMVLHIVLVARGIRFIKIKDESYQNYEKFLLEEEKKDLNLRKKINGKQKQKKYVETALKSDFDIDEVLIKLRDKINTGRWRVHLKTKIIGVFIITIIVILFTFIYTDLNNYKALVSQNANTSGINKAEQASAIYVFSDGLHQKIRAFLEGIKKTNDSAPFPFQRLDMIITSEKEPVFLENVNSFTIFPKFDVFSYTTATGFVKDIPNEEKQITSQDAAFYIKHFKNNAFSNLPITGSKKNTCLYVYPILIPKKEGNKILGFTIVRYLTEVLERPYFQAKVFVFSLSSVFLYISIIIILFLADFIANPIISLCGNIRKTANILSDMISGTTMIESDKLIFDDNTSTNDEIKNLSLEIGNMVSIIRGILPYISFNTLQNAEKKLQNRSYKRDLCFLFTDIRGFTSLCENMNPKEVTSILNYYLDIETKIIFDNCGDVDKYVGDEIMASFSGNKKEINACKAAMEIKKAMDREQKKSMDVGSTPVSIGIGINSGSVVFGPVGAKHRKDFTAIGDAVNLAARLEGANKVYDSKSIISEVVYNNVKDYFICRELDVVTVKGKTKEVRIFEILQPLEKGAESELKDLKTTFEKGLGYYRNRNWEAAEKCFSECIKKYGDLPSKVFIKRINRYKEFPPKYNWKGIFVMNAK